MSRGHGRVVLSFEDGGVAVPARDVDYYVHRVSPGGSQSVHLDGPFDRAECAEKLAGWRARAAVVSEELRPLFHAVKVTTITEPVDLDEPVSTNGEGVS